MLKRYRFIRNNPRFDVCGTDEINEFDAAIDAAINKQIKIEKDAERFQWLTADHDDKEVRKKCRDILERMGAMSYSAACMAIDAAMKEVK